MSFSNCKPKDYREAFVDIPDDFFQNEDSAAQENFIARTKVHTAAAKEIPSIPELDAGQVLLLVEAADQAALALEIVNRNRGITGGLRVPS